MRTTVEKVEDFLKEHKNSYTVKQIAKYFLMNESTIYFACKTLVKDGVVIRKKKTVPSTKLNKSMAFFYEHKIHNTKSVNVTTRSLLSRVLVKFKSLFLRGE